MSLQLNTEAVTGTKLRTRPLAAAIILFGGIAALLLSLALSISVGAADISLSTVWEAVFQFDPDLMQRQVIKELRIPRALSGALAGAALTALLIYVLSYKRQRGLIPVRMILVGIAVAGGVSAAIQILTLRLSPEKYQLFSVW